MHTQIRPKHKLKPLLLGVVTSLLLVATMVIFSFASIQAQSMNDVENPQSGSIGLAGLVPGQPPTVAAAINSPVNGQVITSLPLTVSGTCQSGLIVEIYKNDVFAGSGICSDNNTFSIDIDLFNGENVLIAKVRDLLGQLGPDSQPVTVTYEPPITASDRQIGQRLLLTTTASFRGGSPGSELSFPIQLSGGVGPYAIATSWGDGHSGLLSLSDTGTFTISHAYDRPGVYRLVVQATDEGGQVAFLQLTAIVDGDVDGLLADEDTRRGPTIIRYILWPLYVLLLLLPVAYWLGMRHEKRKYE